MSQGDFNTGSNPEAHSHISGSTAGSSSRTSGLHPQNILFFTRLRQVAQKVFPRSDLSGGLVGRLLGADHFW